MEKYSGDFNVTGISSELRNEIESHLSDCQVCSEYLARYETVVRILSGTEKMKAPAGFKDKILAMTEAENVSKTRRIPASYRHTVIEYSKFLSYLAAAVIIILYSPEIYQATSNGLSDTYEIYIGVMKIYKAVFESCTAVYYAIALSFLA